MPKWSTWSVTVHLSGAVRDDHIYAENGDHAGHSAYDRPDAIVSAVVGI